jgi:putative ABC transport system permease protein
VIGSDDQYLRVRNLVMVAGRFMDTSDVALRQKVCLLTERLARRLYGSQSASIGQIMKVHGLQFQVMARSRKRPRPSASRNSRKKTVLIPITVIRYFTPVERIDPMYVQVRRPEDVEPLAAMVKQVLESRHRTGARYKVDTLTAILDAAKSIALVLTIVLILVSAIALVISGIASWNIMLVTVTERTREIGGAHGVGAARRDVRSVLSEAVLISRGGGLVGILAGISLPLSVQFFARATRSRFRSSPSWWLSADRCSVGIVFGLLPAQPRAARLNPPKRSDTNKLDYSYVQVCKHSSAFRARPDGRSAYDDSGRSGGTGLKQNPDVAMARLDER